MPDWVKRGQYDFKVQVNTTFDFLKQPLMAVRYGLVYANGNNGANGGGGPSGYERNAAPDTDTVNDNGGNEHPQNAPDATADGGHKRTTPQFPVGMLTTEMGRWVFETVAAKLADFNDTIDAWENPDTRTRVLNSTLMGKRVSLEADYRKLHAFIMSNPFKEPGDLVSMGFSEPDSTRTPSPKPHTYPEATSVVTAPHEISISFRDHGSPRKGKPRGYAGVRIIYAILDHQPSTLDELSTSDFFTSSPIRLTFDISDQSKTLYYALCWANRVGAKGTYSAIYSIVIP
jgi:hypothetical protein